MLSIGPQIELVFRQQGRKVSWLAKNLNCHRANVYNIFQRNNIDVTLLSRISQLLNYDFFLYLSNQLRNEEMLGDYRLSKTLLQNDETPTTPLS